MTKLALIASLFLTGCVTTSVCVMPSAPDKINEAPENLKTIEKTK